MPEQESIEEPKKRSTGSGSNFQCVLCEEEIYSFAGAKSHYKETQHAVIINTWFMAIYGTEEDYDNETESKNDY